MNRDEGFVIIAHARDSNIWRPTGTRLFIEDLAIAEAQRRNEESWNNHTGVVWDYAPAAEVNKWERDTKGRYRKGGGNE